MQHRDERCAEVLPIIEDIRLLLVHRLRQAQVTLTVVNQAGAAMVDGDPAKFAQALTNVIANVIDAGDSAAAPTVELTLRTQSGLLLIEVQHHGVGIPANDLPHIFDAFYTTKPVGQGTGLGLAIARDLVLSFHDEIRCRSTAGAGSTFTLELPRIAEARPAAA